MHSLSTHVVVSLFYTADLPDTNAQHKPAGKVRGSELPQEYELEKLIENVENTDPSWNTSIPIYKWKGVQCDEHARVTCIYWGFHGLCGPLQWYWLPRTLQKISVWDNKLTGSIPLDSLPPQLTYFSASGNKLTGSLNLSQLPPELEYLLLNRNLFERYVDLAHLPPNLYELRLQDNKLTVDIDLSRLPCSIEYLCLSRNKFTGELHLQHLPPSLLELYFDHNMFSGQVLLDNIPAQLEVLQLQNNPDLYGEIDWSTLPERLGEMSLDGTQIEFSENICKE